MALAVMDSESGCLPLDYLQGHKDGLEWAAQLAEANHPDTGDWLYDDPIELAKAIRKGPDMPPVQPVADSEPVIVVGDDGGDALSYRRLIQSFEPGTKLYRHAQQPVVPENCVTAEHRRVIEMLLSVCGAAFELADDSCQQDVDGEDCHVVPDDAFQKLSDALDEIENTLPTEDIDRPDVFLAWSAMPRAALKSLLHAQPAPVVPELRVDWQENEFSAGWNACRAAMLAAAQHDTPALNSVQSVVTVPGKWIPVSERMPEDDDFVYIWPRPDFGVELHVGQYCERSYKGGGWYAQVYEQNYGIEWHPITVTHWMPLPAAPQEVNHG
ncbi:DUF551 domain-containing protein [Klebsiella quasipneumoniae subsp. quasipneumoniae]|nr:DUF551 domain-containing protein [Klebsiella quasipneumoniae]MDV0811085.1 DUF551 domain-containing protein [Klebsiella quasipneumoniae subsp. quasipneumoniae]